MQNNSNMNLDGWEPFEKFKKIIAEKGQARVYFITVPCLGRPGRREMRKLQQWLHTKSGVELVFVEDITFTMKGKVLFLKPAIKTTLSTPDAFAEMWSELVKISNSSCGCSLFVNDAQEYDVRVMDTAHVLSERAC